LVGYAIPLPKFSTPAKVKLMNLDSVCNHKIASRGYTQGIAGSACKIRNADNSSQRRGENASDDPFGKTQWR
jgi:hypothetical protein